MKLYIVTSQHSIGPFFASEAAARGYFRREYGHCRYPEEVIEREYKHGITIVEADDETVEFERGNDDE